MADAAWGKVVGRTRSRVAAVARRARQRGVRLFRRCIFGIPGPDAARNVTGPVWFHALLPVRKDRLIVFLADEDLGIQPLTQWLNRFGEDSITVIMAPGATARPADPRIHATISTVTDDDTIEWMVAHGPVDIIVDLRNPGTSSRRTRWVNFFLLLRPRGVYIVAHLGTEDLRQTERAWLTALAEGMGGIEPNDLDLERECMRAVASLTARARVIMIEKRLRHLVKLRDQEVPSLLATRDPMIRVETIERLPPGKFVSGARVVSHASSTAITSLDTAIDVPAMSVRHYTGALTLGGNSLLHTPNSVLPDSFRFAYAPDPTNPQLRNFSRRIVRARASARPTECLVGDFYHVDPQYSGHFGHIMTELVTRLWGWDSAKERIPTLKAVFRRKPGADATLERTLLSAYGIADQDIVCIERPVYVRSVVSATMMWHNWPPYFVHPEIAGVWRRIADALIDVRVPRHEKIFVSRSSRVNRRRCVNAEEVEEFFARRGFVIVYPELLGLNEQAAVFAGARTIAGFGGSAMFNLMYAQRVETVILLYHEAYTARNEHFYALVLGCDIHYFWSTPELQQPESGWSGLAYESEWKFDFPRNGASLAEVLDSI